MTVASWSSLNLGPVVLEVGVTYGVFTAQGVAVTLYTDVNGATPSSTNTFSPEGNPVTLYAAAGEYNLVPLTQVETSYRPLPRITPVVFS